MNNEIIAVGEVVKYKAVYDKADRFTDYLTLAANVIGGAGAKMNHDKGPLHFNIWVDVPDIGRVKVVSDSSYPVGSRVFVAYNSEKPRHNARLVGSDTIL